ncbi:hypothetical protein [Anaeromyxobacter oryzae]|uniref:Uncharacterized protein n=1 Tax=Anaeromyxobacter oryzae TaxID=2918170 RepID=A0ABM7X342_9BACT|nr:hypothetical protein [Anaeromyxobacter oryzae]BDG06211.1 hypothetical protein AMOR_52070 [Anaeromyxobacter oryzae]
MRTVVIPLAAALAALAGPAAAGPSITLNGVGIDGVTGQRFENATVVIDERGDVHIEAKGYAVKTAEAGGAAPAGPGTAGAIRAAGDARPAPGGKPSRRYFLVAEHDQPGTQFDLAIFINAQWIREVKQGEGQVVMEITKYLRTGPNKVVLAATKKIEGDRASYSPGVKLHVVLGEGNVGGGHVMIDDPLVEMTRTAAEIDDRTEEFVLEAR